MASTGAPTGALVLSRPLCECHGEPCYTNGITHGAQRWRCSVKTREQQRERIAANPEPNRERAKRWAKEKLDQRRAIGREYKRRKLGWYEPEGMATEPLRVKELV